MLNRLHIVAFVLIAGCNVSKATFTPIVGSANVDAGTGIDVPDGGDAGSGRCARLGFPSVPLPTTGLGPASVVVADVSGDGKPDLVVANNGANTVSVLVGHGDGGRVLPRPPFEPCLQFSRIRLTDEVSRRDIAKPPG